MTLAQLKQRFKVEPTTRPPRVPYRETITAPAEAKYRHKKQSGGAGQFGEVHMRIRPLKRGEGFRFINEVKGGNIPGQFIPAVEKGVRQAMQTGIVAGYPVQDVEVTVTDGKHHPVDSKEIAFVAAGKWAFINAAKHAQPVLLEPVTSIDLQVPSDNLGAVTGDLLSRRGQLVSTTGLANGDQAIRANVPLVELAEYSSRLNALTAGQGVFTMEFGHYEQAPDPLQEQLAAEWKSTEDTD
jgi:elongation factor G